MNTKKNRSMFKNNLYFLTLIWNACPGRVIANFLVSIINFTSWVFYSVIFIKYIMNAIEKKQSFLSIVLFIIISASIFGIGTFFLNWFQSEYIVKTDAILYEKINQRLFDKATEVELACYEDTEFYNQYTIAMKDIDLKIRSILEACSDIVCGLVAGVCVLINMFFIDRYVVLFVAAPLIGNFVFGKKLNQTTYQRNLESVPYQRKMDYVNRTIYLSDYAKEIRMSEVFHVLENTYESGYSGVIKVIKKFGNKASALGFWQNIFTFLIIFQGVMFYSSYKAIVTQTITLSEFTVLSGAMVSASWILIQLSQNILVSIQNSLYIDNLKTFLEYVPAVSEKQEGIIPDEFKKQLEFKNVSFTYRGQEKPSLLNVSFTLHKNEKIAIVGHNGAGKTTLIKLFMRLYDPSSGKIILDGEEVKNYHLQKFRGLFGTAFQDYQVFSMTVAENVLMRKPEKEEDYEKVKTALIKSGVYEKILSLPKGMDTILTKEFAEDGAVLSGGELQKVAIARVFAKDFEIAVLDEPSSALDPVAEYRLYESMMEVCKNKTVVFISHRLSAAALADRVYMMEHGKIIEEGSHAELMEQGGKYADMFHKQAEKYAKTGMEEELI